MTNEPLQLTAEFCRARQERLRQALETSAIDRVILVLPENIQYLTGFRPHRLHAAAVCLDLAAGVTLAAPHDVPETAYVDQVVTFEAQSHATLRQDQHERACTALNDAVGTGKRLGVEFSATAVALASEPQIPSEWKNVEPVLWQLRRKKDPDELAMIRRAIACTEAMYETAREIIEPGLTELEVYSRLHAAAVDVAGEPLTALGNDFQCQSPGGPPRSRRIQPGELYILDLGPAYRGYYADNCRTFSVSGPPTDEQQLAWEKIVAVLRMVERTVRPGVSCREVFEQAQQMLADAPIGRFPHHLGHGIGLYPHEAPHLNPHWDDLFEEGDVFTAEPGLYADSLRAGIRLEEDYRVTSDGLEKLTSYPLNL